LTTSEKLTYAFASLVIIVKTRRKANVEEISDRFPIENFIFCIIKMDKRKFLVSEQVTLKDVVNSRKVNDALIFHANEMFQIENELLMKT
jgi:hypothetical protein